MKLIVGLGNPGNEYENTRHNVGFMVLDNYAKTKELTFSKSMGGLYSLFNVDDVKVMLLKPQLFMNLSGEVVKKFVDYYKIDIDDILIINDDLDLKVGKYKLKDQGSSGGHNGLKNIELHLKTSKYKRLKIGISNNKTIETKDYVLGHINKEDKESIDEIVKISAKILNDYLYMDFSRLMNKYNHK